MNKKTISVTGPNGTFKGEIIASSKTIFKKVKLEGNNYQENKTVVHDIQTTVNGHLFGCITKNVDDEAILEIELIRHEGLLKAHLNKLAKTEAGVVLKTRMDELGFKESKLATKVKIDDLSSWILEHTKRVGFDSRRGPREKTLVKRRREIA